MSKLLYIRHAQASFMAKNYDQLSDLGYRQSKVLGEYLVTEGLRFDKIYVGPLKRHHQTLQMVQEAYQEKGIKLPEPILMPELIEHRGPAVYRHMLPTLLETDEKLQYWDAEVKANPKILKRNHLRMFHHTLELWARGDFNGNHPEHLQSWTDFRAMVTRGLKRILEENKDKSGLTIAAFTSGGTVSAATGEVLQMEKEEKIMELNGAVQNTAITEFMFSKGKIGLKSFNTIPHLKEKELVTFV